MTDLVARLRLTAHWAALVLLYLYADVFNFFEPGELDHIGAEKLEPFDVPSFRCSSQSS